MIRCCIYIYIYIYFLSNNALLKCYSYDMEIPWQVLGYMYPLEPRFSPGTCPGVGLLGHIVRNLHTVSQSGCTNLIRLAKSSLGFCCKILEKTQTNFLANIYIHSHQQCRRLQQQSDLIVIQVKTWWELWNNPHSWVFSSLLGTSAGTTDYISLSYLSWGWRDLVSLTFLRKTDEQ